MKQYVVDQLRLGDHHRLKAYLEERLSGPALDGLYWLMVPSRHLSPTQREHTDCQPFYFALELQDDALWCELLIRSQTRIRCDCIAYADADQQLWLIARIDEILDRLEIQI